MLSHLFSRRTARALGVVAPRGVLLDAETLEPLAELPAGGRHADLVAAPDGVWISSYEKRTLSLVAPDGTERLRVDLPKRPSCVTLDGDRPIVLCDGERILRVEPVEGRIVEEVAGPAGTSSVAAGDGQVWLLAAEWQGARGYRLALMQLDPATLAATREIDLGVSLYHDRPRIHAGTVSVLHETSPGSMGLSTFDVATGAPAPTPEELTRPRGIATRDGSRWFVKDREIKRIDVASGRELASHRLEAPRTGACLLAHGRIWATTYRTPSNGENGDTN